MAPRKFLRQVVDYYMERCRGDISGITFVLPNKRSAMFLKKYIQEAASGIMFMPRITTLGRLVERFSAIPVADRQEQIFTLYTCYAKVLEDLGRSKQLKDFDRFLFWGEIILSDFNEIDRSLANAQELFANLRDYKEIRADYLEPEQKELVRAIWGDTQLTGAREEFWLHVPHGNGSDADSMADQFVSLWEVLGKLYDAFQAALLASGLTTEGRQMRMAVDALRAKSADEITPGHIAFVGFSELTVAETAMLKRLKDCGKAEFFWDVASELFYDAEGRFDRTATECHRLERLLREFPMPEDFSLDCLERPVEIEVIGVSSEVAQAKMITPILDEWFANGGIPSADEAFDTAIVLADEGLLLPVLSAIPEGIPMVNITMGLPYISTPFAALLRSVISMQLRARRIAGRIHFYYEDVKQVMASPYFQTIAPAECDTVRRWLLESKLYNIPTDELAEKFPTLTWIFSPVADPDSVEQVQAYTTGLVGGLRKALSTIQIPDSTSDLFELRVLDVIETDLEALGERIRAHNIRMSEHTYFHLFERLLATQRINLTGKPLQGLQIMGMLETRALDFDRVIILSMNERVMPRRNLLRSLIPESLRLSFMLPSRADYESDYAYHFVRLLSRAESVKLLYDSRSAASKRTGEMSRFLTRLLYNDMPARIRVAQSQVAMPGSIASTGALDVVKTPDVMRELDGFRPGGRLNLSASAIKTFKKCPLQFYLQYVKSLRADEDVTDYIDEAGYGSILHRVVELLYRPLAGLDVTADRLRTMAREEELGPIVERVVATHYLGRKADDMPQDRLAAAIPPEGNVMAEVVKHLVRRMLQYEEEAFCHPAFSIVGAEQNAPTRVWHVADGLDVNFKLSIDRVDRVSPAMLRFIDYKTGSDAIASTYDGLFTPDHDGDALLQLLIYCEAWQTMTGDDTDIIPYVYPFRMMSANGGIVPIKIDGEDLTSYNSLKQRFSESIATLIGSIFDPEQPFAQCSDQKHCVYCPFITMCGRTPKTF